jgi:hypothetical protein
MNQLPAQIVPATTSRNGKVGIRSTPMPTTIPTPANAIHPQFDFIARILGW